MKVNRTALRTIEILEYIAKSQDGVSLLEIAQALDIPKSSVFDILKTLLYKNMIVENQVGGKIKYSMGIHSFIVGSHSLERFDLVNIAKKYLIPLSKEFYATTFLAVLDEGMVTYLYKCESPKSQITTANLGSRKSIHCTALGKVLMAFQKNEQIVNQALQTTQFIAHTQYTITSIPKYLQELEKVKHQGYAVDNREDTLSQICVAAPIFNHNKKIIAAISLVNSYSKQLDIEELSKFVKNSALQISKELGYVEEKI